jgi:hypothetical protein
MLRIFRFFPAGGSGRGLALCESMHAAENVNIRKI